jgi:MoxR-like ATPase
MLDVMADVNAQVAERGELIELIAIALLTRKNLFILGDTGQAKSFAINEFRRRIMGAKQFERLMSKQTDEEQLFGRLDLASLIPGHMPRETALADANYRILYNGCEKAYENYAITGDGDDLTKAEAFAEKMRKMEGVLYALRGSEPKINTEGKIPDSHVCFLDEIFKANDGILNSLLTALNERTYTNEGETVQIPVISFFSASNEIPDFNDPAEKILKPLYDRFDLKCFTRYVEDRENRLDALTKKQKGQTGAVSAAFALQELVQMQNEVRRIPVPDAANELMDDALIALRTQGIHVSDRKYFNYAPVAQAAAWLRGGSEVSGGDLLVLKNYLWTKPEEIEPISQTLARLCENPLRGRLEAVKTLAAECFEGWKTDAAGGGDVNALRKFRAEILRVYGDIPPLGDAASEADRREIEDAVQYLEDMNRETSAAAGFTCTPLSEQKQLN